MTLPERYADLVTTYSKTVVAVMLVATLVVGAGAANVDGGLSITSFESDSTEAEKLDYAEANFATDGENATVVQVVVRGDDVLSKASLLSTLRFQRSLREDPDVNPTLRERQPVVGLSNVVATAAIRAEAARNGSAATGGEGDAGAGAGGDGGDGGTEGAPPRQPSLDEQIAQLEAMSEAEVEAVVERVLDPSREARGPVDPYAFLSTDYEPGSTTASGRITFVFQDTGGAATDDLPPAVTEAQLEIRDRAAEEIRPEAFAFGVGIVDEEAGAATGESFAIISPVALLLIVALLGLAYRDVLDVVLGLAGVVLVLAWMGGAMGWLGIGVTQLIIAVPFLLVGLSIDYALHVVMRYREAQVDDPAISPTVAMRRGLAGVVVAIGAATFSTAVGFGSNVVSPIVSIQQFGTVAAVGIVSAFLVFGVLLPPLKLELEEVAERVGLSREKRPFGRGGVAGRALGVGATVARRAPVVVVAVAVVLSAGGAVAATDIDTSIDQVDFLPRDTPEWMSSLPEPFRPSDYSLRSNAMYINDEFVQSRDQSRAILLVEGSVTDSDTLERLVAAERDLSNTSSAVTLADGGLRVDGPLQVVERTAAENETVAAVVDRNDVNGDGVPDRNLSAVYDAVYRANPDAAKATIYREDGEYRALRVSVALAGGADTGTVTAEMRTVAATLERGSDLTATATGAPIVQELVQRGLLVTLVQGFAITFGVIVAFLTAIFWRRYGTLSLGAVVMTPVVLALSWLFATMYLAGISFNTETAIIASIAIGVGVDYAIHIGERYVEELRSTGEAVPALERTLAGTGGALLASATSTAGGFGVLLLALVPSLQRFGFVTATAIAYAFVASVLVLPSLLVLWTRHADVDLERTVAAAPDDD
ncbi:MMPL family transporter [Halorubellus sp. JP-L1]|uniref:efflux RND transporter permease subunit n=1 Tax=Halorubellus sp. JP-L1 TaxID=2715753 RepID=UPI00140B7D00|nr:MMPL family transporter [Halorubellus sp. JP-L1]NHN43315.1 MMPL family transporter [Halorubellus sp. JP-L1]